MASVHDVADHLLDKYGPMDTMKLQKLVYFSQAWHLVWESEPLFDERIEAWANGPVVRELFNEHRGRFRVSDWPKGDAEHLSDTQKDIVDIILDEYGPLTGHRLSVLTHEENSPWSQTRDGLAVTQRSDREIPCELIQEYYFALWLAEDSVDIDEIEWDDI